MLTATHNYTRALPQLLPSLREIVDRVRQALPRGLEVCVAWVWAEWRSWELSLHDEFGIGWLGLGPARIYADWNLM